jgi:flagellar hook-associated protein 1 FlgK
MDELGGLISIVYDEDETGFVRIRAEGEEFVTKGGCFHMAVDQMNAEDGSTYETPVWPQNGYKQVFNLSVEINTENNNDIGTLKGLVQARGGYAATYKDIPHVADAPTEADYTDENGVVDNEALAAAAQQYWNVDYPAYLKEVQEYETTVATSPIMKTQAMFDQLINQVVTTINDLLCPNNPDTTISAGTTITIPAGTIYNQLDDGMKEAMTEAGITKENSFNAKGVADNDITFTLQSDTTVTALDMEKASYGMDDDSTPGTELFSRKDTVGRYTTVTDGDGNKIYLYNANNEFGTEGDYTVKNLRINQVVLDDYSYLPFTTEDKEVNMQLAQDILDAWDTASINLNPDNMTPKDFNDYYSSMVSILANDGYVYQAISENQNSAVTSLDEARVSFTGVSSNDELSNLIMYQNAFNANSRYINVVSEMLDTLITKVGNW